MGLAEQENMADLNWGKGEQCQNILGNKGTKKKTTNFTDQKAGNKFTYILKGALPCCFFFVKPG